MDILVIILLCSFFIIQSACFIFFFLWIRKNWGKNPQNNNREIFESSGSTRCSYELKDTPMVVVNVHNSDGGGRVAATPITQTIPQPQASPAAAVMSANAPAAAPSPSVPPEPSPPVRQAPARPAHPEAPKVVTPEPQPEAVTSEPTTKKCKNCGADNSPFREKCFRCNTPL